MDNPMKVTDLMRAVNDEDITILLKLLLTNQYKANVFAKDSKGRTALDWARMCRNYQAVTLLTKAMSTEIDNSRLDSMKSTYDLENYLIETNKYQSIELLKALKQRDINQSMRILQENRLYREELEGLNQIFFTDIVCHSDYSSLIIAAGFNMITIIDLLIEYKAPIDHQNKFGHTAFTYACAAGNSDVVRLLLFHGSNINHITNDGRTGLHYACKYAKGRTVKVILDYLLERFLTFRIAGHSMIDFDYTRWTKYADILETFINVKDKDGNTAFHLLPTNLPSNQFIEVNLRVRRVKSLMKLNDSNHHQEVLIDHRSTTKDYDFAYQEDEDKSIISDLAEDFSYIDDYYNNSNHKSNCNNYSNLNKSHHKSNHKDEFDDETASILSDVSAKLDIDCDTDEVLSTQAAAQSITEYSHDTDNKHADGIHNITDAHSIKTALPLEQELLTIQVLFIRTKERISEWLHSAMKEKELASLVPCILNCGLMCTVESLTYHVRDDCPYRSIQCKACYKMCTFIDVKKHHAKLCMKRIVACKNAYQGCNEFMCFDYVESHLLFKCKLRLVVCRQFCGTQIPYTKRENHELNHCKNRQLKCDRCMQDMVANQYATHLLNECPERMIKCSITCNEFFKAKDIHHHENEVCKRPCKWKCGQSIGPPSKLVIHEINYCSNKLMNCMYLCGTVNLTLKDIDDHHTNICILRPTACSLLCGETLPNCEIPMHIDAWKGICPKRLVRCPSNLVGWKINLLDYNEEGIVLKHRHIQKGSENIISQSDEYDGDKVGNEQLFVRMKKRQIWIDVWKSNYILIKKVMKENQFNTDNNDINNTFKCTWITYENLEYHLHYECENREIYLASNIDHKLGLVGQRTEYKDVVHIAELRNNVDEFIDKTIDHPIKTYCEFCSIELLKIHTVMEDHLKNDCPEILIKCPYVCGETIVRKNLEKHLLDSCNKRLVLCIDCNSNDLWAEEFKQHQEHLCGMRLIDCKLDCKEKVLSCEVDHHQRTKCPRRLEQCSCGLTMEYKDLDEHKKLNCNDRCYYCPQGCGVLIKAEEEERHIEFQCANKNFKYQKEVDCPNVCGNRMMIRDIIEHLSYYCPRRLIECTLNCGNSIQLDKLPDHISFCPMRILPCEPDMLICSRVLHQWFRKEKAIPQDIDIITIDNSTYLGIEDIDTVKSNSSINRNTNNNVINNNMNMNVTESVVTTATTVTIDDNTSSIFLDDFKMKFHHHLRMYCCEHHGSSIIMSAIKHNDLILMEYIMKQTRESEDIDFENVFGDTALTLACRLGRYEFIVLLVEHMADVNKETSNGRTALIEATKAPVENVAVIEYLIRAGSIVNYKTKKHHKTALDWARLTDRRASTRILDLAGTVQVQSNKLLMLISRGQSNEVYELIKEGEFFDPNGEEKYYLEMKRFAELEDENHFMVRNIRKNLDKRKSTLDSALNRYNKIKENYKSAQESLQYAFNTEDQVNKVISKEFSIFEQTSLKLTNVDILESLHVYEPEYLLRLSMFSYGIIFGLLESSDYSLFTPCNRDNTNKWYSIIKQEFQKSIEVVRKIQSFTIAKLDGGKVDLLYQRIKLLFDDFIDSFQKERKKKLNLSRASIIPNENNSLTNNSYDKTNIMINTTNSINMNSYNNNNNNNALLIALENVVATVNNYNNDNISIDNKSNIVVGSIKDEDWDSDAEYAGDGEWIKGEWVAKNKKKDKWWEINKNNDNNNNNDNKLMEEEKMDKNIKNRYSDKLVYLSDDMIDKTVLNRYNSTKKLSQDGEINIEFESNMNTSYSTDIVKIVTSENDGTLMNDTTINRTKINSSNKIIRNKSLLIQQNDNKREEKLSNRRSSKISRSKSMKENISISQSPLDISIAIHMKGIDPDLVEAYPFVEAMFAMLKASIRYAQDREHLQEAKRETSKKSIYFEDIKIKHQSFKESYNHEFENRANDEMKLIECLKKERFYKIRVQNFLGKVRVSRLLNHVSSNGHTPLSWAASLGCYDIVEHMLSHGSPIGFTTSLIHLTATYLQMSYKIYLKNISSSYRPPNDSFCLLPPVTKVDHIQIVRDITELKVKRGKVLSAVVFQRSRIRFPLPEAIYSGKWEIVKRIYERRLLHSQFINSWIFPLAPVPFTRNCLHQYEHHKITLREICLHGMSDLAAGSYVSTLGWVGPNDPKEPYGETQILVNDILIDLKKKKDDFLNGRYRIRLLSIERKNQKNGELEMLEAIKDKDFKKCIYLAKRRGITIDLETKEGYTVLLSAAEENVDATNHTYMNNDDGRKCLAVEYLLDRTVYRPSIDLESTVSGHTALIRACILSRAHVVEALLDRGANINHVNRFGRTALHYTASSGDQLCTRMLIERFADKFIKDNNGQTPYEIADTENFMDVMKILSQFQGGYLGPVQVSRGKVNNIVKCPIGCGIDMFPYETKAHSLVCEWRPAICPNNCSETRLLFKEMPDHLERACTRRLVECVDCVEILEIQYLENHLAKICSYRIVPCTLGCGYNTKFCDIEKHHLQCGWRYLDCPMQCGMKIKSKDFNYHQKEECENRRVLCPYKCRGLIVAKLVPNHMKTICINRPLECRLCKDTISKKKLEEHEKQCIARYVTCINKCNALVRFCDAKTHLITDCIHRFVECSLKCGIKVRYSDIEFHQSMQCLERLVDCEYGCIENEQVPISERKVTRIVAKVMSLHLKYECSERLLKCSLCLQSIKSKDNIKHDQNDCNGRKIKCSNNGCLKECTINDIETHEKFKCRFRLVICKQSCNELIPYIHNGKHMREMCTMRFIQCTNNCGMKLRYNDLKEHLELECIRRNCTSTGIK